MTRVVLWSDIVKVFAQRYDEVFGNAGRKAYFDFNRVKSKSANVTDNIIDGAKETWKLPLLMDAVACCFFNVQHNAYRQKSRKFNQHDILIQAIQTLSFPVDSVTSSSESVVPILDIDIEVWTSFISLQRELHNLPPKKNIDKYIRIISMLLENEDMVSIGLSAVLHGVFDSCLTIDTSKLGDIKYSASLEYSRDVSEEGDVDFEAEDNFRQECDEFGLTMYSTKKNSSFDSYATGIKNMKSKKRSLSSDANDPSAGSSDSDSAPMKMITKKANKAMLSSYFQEDDGTPFAVNKILNKAMAKRSRSSPVTKVVRTLDTSLLFSIRTMCNANLQKVYGDGAVIGFAAAAAENANISLAEKLNDFEWVFRASNQFHADKILLSAEGKLRVLGYNVIASRLLPSI